MRTLPLYQLVSTMAATINKNSTSTNVQDVLPALLRMCDPDDLAECDSWNVVDMMECQILRKATGGAVSLAIVAVGFLSI